MGVFLFFVAFIGVCLIIAFIGGQADYNSQREYNGKRYRYQVVGMDVNKAYKDSIKVTLGDISKQEYKRRDSSHQYSIYAWVEVGKQPYTWRDDPINRDIYFRYAHETETLPKYLQYESGCMTVKQYREKNK